MATNQPLDPVYAEGDVYLAKLDANHNPIRMIPEGCAATLTLQQNASVTSLMCKKIGKSASPIGAVPVFDAPTGELVFNQMSRQVYEALFAGKAITIDDAEGTVTGELKPITAAGELVLLEFAGVSTVTADRTNASSATTWVTVTDYTVGAFAYDTAGLYTSSGYVEPVAPNDHFYKCIVAGTTDATEPATWPIDGSTVEDGTVTWQDMGLKVAAMNTDYSVGVSGARLGTVTPIETGNLEFGDDDNYGEQLSFAYTYSARKGFEINSGTDIYRENFLLFDGFDLNSGTYEKCTVPRLKMIPNGPINLLADGFRTASFTLYPQLNKKGDPLWTLFKPQEG